MQSVGRDPFGLDMIPETDMSEMEDREEGLAGNLPVPLSKCLHRIAQLDFVDVVRGDRESIRQSLRTWMWRISEVLRRL